MIEHRGREYEVIQSSRKTFSIILDRNGRFIIRCPHDTTEQELHTLLDQKLEWIERKSIEWEEIENNRNDQDDLLSIKYLGRRWSLQESQNVDAITFVNGQIHVPNGYLQLRKEERKKQIRAFFTKRGYLKIPSMVKKSAVGLGVEIPKTQVLDLGFRWGSCSQNKTVNFHWKCMTLPSNIVQYIVSHEVAHLIVPDHSKRFWRVLEKASPDFEAHEKWLKDKGINFDLY